MKLTIQTKELLTAVNACAKVILAKNALAILDNVLLAKKDECYTLTGANSDHRYETVLDSLIVTEGEFQPICLNARVLREALANLTDDLLQIEVKEEQVKVQYEGGEFNFSGMKAEEYPVAPVIADGATEFTITNADEFFGTVKRANVFTVNDDLRPTMAGVCLDIKQDSLVVVGSDGHKLFKYTMPDFLAGYLKGDERQAIIPKSLVPALDNLRTSENVVFKADGRQMSFTTDTEVITARMIEGKYPNYNAVIPADAATAMMVNVKTLTQVVKRISVFASQTTCLLKLAVKDGQISLSTEDIDFAQASQELLPVVSHNLPEGLQIGLSYTTLLTVIGSILTENAQLLISDPSKAVKFKADPNANDPTIAIQMPMLL